MTGVASLWLQTPTGEVFELTSGSSWRVGADPTCEVVIPGDGPGDVWFQVRHAAVWSVKPATSSVQVTLNGRPLPHGRGTALEHAGPHVVGVSSTDLEANLRLLTGPPNRQGGPLNEPDQTIIKPHPMSLSQPVPRPPPSPDPLPPPPPPARPVSVPASGASPPSVAGPGGQVFDLTNAGRVTIGRMGGSAQHQLSGIDIAEVHAQVEWRENRLHITDRSRGLGVHVKGHAVLLARLAPGEEFVIGHHALKVATGKILAMPLRQGGSSLVATQVSATYARKIDPRRSNTPTLNGLTFALPDQSFLAVVGPSGAGKSSLCRVILGELANVEGSLRFRDFELSKRHSLWHLISFVPQEVSLPMEMKVSEAISLVARLRLPSDLSRAQRNERCRAVLTSMDLVTHEAKLIDELSGGQKRRVSVAMELLSDPLLLVLDEPTSGLDEGLDKRLMQLLRQLVEQGTSVVVVTHSTANLEIADSVLAITSHGQVGYFGPAARLREGFGVASYSEVMDELRSGKVVSPPHVRTNTALPGATQPMRGRRSQPGTTWVMLRREMIRVSHRKPWLLLNMLAPLVVALLAVGAGGSGLQTPTGSGEPQMNVVLSVLAICIAFTATQVSFTSIVADRSMILRESRWGFSVSPVVLSRAILACTIAVLQSIAACVLFILIRGAPDEAVVLGPASQLIVSMALLAMASCCLGLVVSASANTLEQAVFALMGVSVFQVVLCGLLIRFNDPESPPEFILAGISWLAPTRWGTSAVAASMNLGDPPRGPDGAQLPPARPVDWLWTNTAGHVYLAWMALVVISIVCVFGSVLLVRKSTRSQV